MDQLNIFISYSKNRKQVRVLAEDIRILGHTVWFDENLIGGHDWWIDILQRIRECDLFVFVITQESLASVACTREFEYAQVLKKRVLPVVMAGGVKLSLLRPDLQSIQAVDYHKRGIYAYQRLIHALHHLKPAQALPDPLPALPETPISPLAVISKRVKAPEPLTQQEQASLIFDLRNLVKNMDKAIEARQILRGLKKRGDLLATAEHEVLAILTPRCLGALQGHTDAVQSAFYNYDGTRIVTGSRDGTVRVWDAQRGTELFRLNTSSQGVYEARFSPNGRVLATATADGMVRLWSAETGRRTREFMAHAGGVFSLSYHPTGRFLATSGADEIGRIWNVRDGVVARELKGHTKAVYSINYNSDGTHLVTASGDSSARTWDAATGKELLVLCGHTRAVHSAAFSPDGKRVVTASGDGTARVWDAETGKELLMMSPNVGRIYWATYSGDGRMIITANADGKARLWDANAGVELMQLEDHQSVVYKACYSPSGDTIVTASGDNTARVWDMADLAWG